MDERPTVTNNNIVLIGPMGAGKSSVLKQLARLTKKTAYDSDSIIELQTGVSISWIFEKEGEQGFRRREAEVIGDLLKTDNIVLATGAGCVLTSENRTAIAASSFVAFIDITLEEQLYRTRRRKSHRPLIDNEDPEASLRTLNTKRRPHYKALATNTYNATRQAPYEIARAIYRDWKKTRKK